MPRAYISAKIENELEVKKQRDTLWLVTGAHRYYKKVDPHITIIPPFTVKEGHEKDVESVVSKLNMIGKSVNVTDFNLYEDIQEPYVVMLSVDVDLQNERNVLMNELAPHTKGNIVEPVAPHITLFKTQGWWDDIDGETRKRLKYEMDNRQSAGDTKIRTVTVDFN